jgi:hypothetical protein
MGPFFSRPPPALSAAAISKVAVKPAAATLSPTNSSSVAIPSAKNVTEYHAVALVSTRRGALDPVDPSRVKPVSLAI